MSDDALCGPTFDGGILLEVPNRLKIFDDDVMRPTLELHTCANTSPLQRADFYDRLSLLHAPHASRR